MYKVITKKLVDDAVLWRYMDLSKYLSLLSDQSLWLARSDTFADKREGVFHPAMRRDLDEIYHSLSSEGKINSSDIENTDDFQNHLSNNTYINCWHKSDSESMIMWEIYGQSENSIAIKTTPSKLKNSFNLDNVMKDAIEVALDDVIYEDHDKAASEKCYRQPFFLKRPHFSFEQEVRLYFRARHTKSKSEAPYGYKITVDLNQLIDEIYVHPDAEDWFFHAVKDLNKKYDIRAPLKRGVCGNKF